MFEEIGANPQIEPIISPLYFPGRLYQYPEQTGDFAQMYTHSRP
jgi:hypothetical protein